ncbi:unnamed protein product [Linum tenue]|uniref:Cell number regulator 6 n=1 Tax=Linum tenue TaxID=586396 RepID=A0AAV0I8F0_9ROSI|nr:unnamed protein product [Linum tenue]
MGDASGQSRYVKLTKEQGPAEDITPGELNQPIQVPQLIIHRCHECGQPLPESYEPPADEDWTTGLFSCAQDPDSCRRGLLCPCVLFGENVETVRGEEYCPWRHACVCHAICVEGGIAAAALTASLGGIDVQTSLLVCEGLLFAWWMCGIHTGLFRESLQKKYHLKESPCDACLVHCCFHWCAICQEHREMRNHLSYDSSMQVTVVNPPPLQQMTVIHHDASTISSLPSVATAAQPVVSDTGHVRLEIQPV